jgi:alpha-galactosidase
MLTRQDAVRRKAAAWVLPCALIFATQARAAPKTWTVSNELIRVTYSFDPGAGALRLASLRDVNGGVEWAGSAGEPVFRFTFGGEPERTFDSRSGWTLEALNAGSIRLFHPEAQAAIEIRGVCAPGYPVVQRSYRLENRAPQRRVLADAAIISDPIGWSSPAETFAFRFDTKGTFLRPSPPEIRPAGAFKKTASNQEYAPMMMLRQAGGAGLFWGWAYSGRTWFSMERGLFQAAFRGSQGGAGPQPLNYQLEPGESFSTPEQFIGVFRGDWDDGCYLSQRYADRFFSGVTEETPRYPLTFMDSWAVYSIHEQKLKGVIDWASRAGVEAMDIDYGWAINGDWKPLARFFPSGLPSLVDYAKSKGIEVILHLPFGNVDHESELYQAQPAWTYGRSWKLWKDETGRQGTASSLCLTDEAARNWLLDRLSQTIRETGIIGFNIDSFLFTPDNLPCPVRTGAAAKAAPEYAQYVFGLYDLLARLLARHPGLVIENAGGTLGPPVYDYATARWFRHTISTVSVPVADRAPEYIRALYNITYLVSPRWPAQYLAPSASPDIGVIAESDAEAGQARGWGHIRLNDFCARIFLMGGPFYLELDPEKLDPAREALLRKYVQLYKEIRPWASTGKVLHLIDPGDWAALGIYSPARDRAIIAVWRYQGPQDRMTVPMKSLNPGVSYDVRLADAGVRYTATGAEIMRKGIPVALEAYVGSNGEKSSELIFISAASR